MISAFPGQASAVAVVASGTHAGDVVVAGYAATATCGAQQPVVVEYKPDGTLDNGFGTSGRFNVPCPVDAFLGSLSSVTLDASGNIVVAGQVLSASGTLQTLVARMSPLGVPDPTFGTGGVVAQTIGSGNSVTQAVAVSPVNNDIITAGSSYVGGASTSSLTVAAFTPTGQLDTSFATSGVATTSNASGTASAVVVGPDGTITAAGNAQVGSRTGSLLAQFGPDGSPKSSFGSGGEVVDIPVIGDTNELHALAYQASGNVLVAVGSAFSGASQEMVVAHYDATNGQLDTSFGAAGVVQHASVSGASSLAGVAVQGDGKAVGVGVAPTVNSAPSLGLVRLLEPLVYSGIPPTRVCDTRPGFVPNPCTGHALAPGVPLVVPLPAAPAGTGAVVANVTVTNPSGPGFVTVFPTGQVQPGSSNLNFTTGQTVANLVTLAVGTSQGQPAISVVDGILAPTVDVIVDVEGYEVAAGAAGTGGYHPLTPSRVADTRCATNPPLCTLDGLPAENRGDPTIGPGMQDSVTVNNLGGVPAAGVSAVVVNVTVVSPSQSGFVTVAPGGSIPAGTTPGSSNLNFVAREVLANKVVVPVSAGGTISVFNYAGNTDVIIDVDGWYSSSSDPLGATLTPVAPVRLADTRCGVPSPPSYCPGEALPPVNANDHGPAGGQAITVGVAGTTTVPSSIDAAVLNVVDIAPTAPNYLTVYPTGSALPPTSDLNWVPADTYNIVPNAAYATTGTNGAVNVFNGSIPSARADIIADLFGYYTPRPRS